MANSRRESHHRNGITDLDSLQQTSATKSAQSVTSLRRKNMTLLANNGHSFNCARDVIEVNFRDVIFLPS
jgi:hypothetical protein